MPNALVFKNQLLAATKDVRGAIDLCEETLKLLRADLDKGGGRKSKSPPRPLNGVAAGPLKGSGLKRPPAASRRPAPKTVGMPTGHKLSRRANTPTSSGSSRQRPASAGKHTRYASPPPATPNPKDVSMLKVVIRKRPPSEGEEDCVECVEEQVQVREAKVKVDLTKYVQTHVFEYDDTFDEHESTGDLYERSAAELIENFYQGGTSTCFCFGQTASGKTFTMFGAGGGLADAELDDNGDNGAAPAVEAAARGEDGGLYMLAAEDVFRRLEARPDLNLNVSMFEIYGQKVRDLLSEGRELQALEDGKGVLQLVGLVQEPCTDMEAFLHTTNVGRGARSTTATDANATSSRSHAAMLLRLVDGEGKGRGKFSFIDLAGAERGADHETGNAKTKMEGRQINQSLLALKEVIRAKALGRSHAPYRQSRLTQVLEESLTGSTCHTTVIGCISPCQEDIHSTVNTLRYAESLHPHPRKAGSRTEPKPTKAKQVQLGFDRRPAKKDEEEEEEEEEEEDEEEEEAKEAQLTRLERTAKLLSAQVQESASASISYTLATTLGTGLGTMDLLGGAVGDDEGDVGGSSLFRRSSEVTNREEEEKEEDSSHVKSPLLSAAGSRDDDDDDDDEEEEGDEEEGDAKEKRGESAGEEARRPALPPLLPPRPAAPTSAPMAKPAAITTRATRPSLPPVSPSSSSPSSSSTPSSSSSSSSLLPSSSPALLYSTPTRNNSKQQHQQQQQQQQPRQSRAVSDPGNGQQPQTSWAAAVAAGSGDRRVVSGGRMPSAASRGGSSPSTVPEGTMSHAAKFLQDNPTMRKSLHRNQNHEVNDPRRTRSLDPGSSSSTSRPSRSGSSSSSSSSRDHTSPEEDTFSPLRDALSDVLAEFGEEALFLQVHKFPPSDQGDGSAPAETMFNGLEELLALGPDGVHDLGVPRIEAKKLVKRAGEMAEVRRLLVDCGVDAGKWFEPLHRAGVSRLDHLRDLGRDPLVNFGLPPEQAEKVVAALSAGRPMGSEARGGNTNGGTRGRASSTPPPLQRKAPRTPNLSAAAIGSPM